MVSLQERTLLLIDKAKEGREDAFSELFNTYKPKIYLNVSKILKNKDDIEDVTMEVIEKIFNNLYAYRPTHNFNTWIAKVSKNYAIDFIRGKNMEFVPIEKDFINNDTPEIRLINIEQLNRLEKRIASLKVEQLDVLNLYCLENLCYKEISKILNTPINTCRSYLFRARKILNRQNGTN